MDNQKKLQGKRVAIVLTDDFEQVEMTEPRKALDEAGAITRIVLTKAGQVQGFNHDTKGDSFKVDLTLDQANPDEFDAVLLPGGAINADKLRIEPKAQEFIRSIDGAGKPIAVICHAPWLLVSAGLVKGRRMTSFETIQDDIVTPVVTGLTRKRYATVTGSAVANRTTFRPLTARCSICSGRPGPLRQAWASTSWPILAKLNWELINLTPGHTKPRYAARTKCSSEKASAANSYPTRD